MARPSHVMADEAEEQERESPGSEDDGIDFEPGEQELPQRSHDPKRYVVPLAGVFLATVLVALAWVSFAPRRGPPLDRTLLDLPQPASATVDRPPGNPSVKSRGYEVDPRLGPEAPGLSAQRSPDPPRLTHSSDSPPQQLGSTEDLTTPGRVNSVPAGISSPESAAIAQRLDRIDESLQTLRAALDKVQMELSARRAAEPRKSAVNTEKHLDSHYLASGTRDLETVRLPRGSIAKGHPSIDLKVQSQRAATGSGLPGWEIVGLTVRNVALRDPGGRTHVVAIGETIVDEVELTQIDTVANRITTTAGDITYRDANSERRTE